MFFIHTYTFHTDSIYNNVHDTKIFSDFAMLVVFWQNNHYDHDQNPFISRWCCIILSAMVVVYNTVNIRCDNMTKYMTRFCEPIFQFNLYVSSVYFAFHIFMIKFQNEVFEFHVQISNCLFPILFVFPWVTFIVFGFCFRNDFLFWHLCLD